MPDFAPDSPYAGFDPSQFVTVQTPNGPMQLPPSIASRFGQQPPPIDPSVAGAPFAPAAPPISSVTGGQLPLAETPAPPAVSVPAAPDIQLAPIAPPSTADIVKGNKAYDVAQAKNAAYSASPEGQLAKTEADRVAAVEQEKKTAAERTAVETADASKASDIYTKAIADNDKIKAEQQAIAARDASDQMRIRADVADAEKKYANFKPDRTWFGKDAGWGKELLGAIAIAMSGIGAALDRKGGTNPALDLIMNLADKRVAGQLADHAELAGTIDRKSHALSQLMDVTKSNQSTYQLALSGTIEDAKRQIAAISARSESAKVKLAGQDLLTQLSDRQSLLREGAVQGIMTRTQEARKQAEVERANKANEGVQWAHVGLARKTLDEQIREHDLQRQDKLDETALGWAKLGMADKAAKAKEVATAGVFDPSTGNSVLNPEGQKQADQADKLERAAETAPDAQRAKLLAQAKSLRDEAEANGFTIADKDIRKETIKKVGASQNLIDTIADMKATLATDPSSLDRETWARLGTNFERAKTAWIEAHGAKVSSREMQAVEEMFGSSPESMMARAAGRGKMLSRLNDLERGAISETSTELRANGYKGDWRPHSVQSQTADTLQGKTAIETGESEKPGPATTGLRFWTSDQIQNAAENNATTAPTGLDQRDDSLVTSMIDTYNSPNSTMDQRQKIKNQLALYIRSDRESLANGVLTRLREDPALYNDLKKTLPEAKRKAVEAFDSAAATGPRLTLTPSKR